MPGDRSKCPAAQVLDLNSGEMHLGSPFDEGHVALAIDDSGSMAALLDLSDIEDQNYTIRIVDLNSTEVVATVNRQRTRYIQTEFRGEDSETSRIAMPASSETSGYLLGGRGSMIFALPGGGCSETARPLGISPANTTPGSVVPSDSK